MELHKKSPTKTFFFLTLLNSWGGISFYLAISTSQWVAAEDGGQLWLSKHLVIGRLLVRIPWSTCKSVLEQDAEPQTAPEMLVGTSCMAATTISVLNWNPESFLVSSGTAGINQTTCREIPDHTQEVVTTHWTTSFNWGFFYLTKISDSQNRMLMMMTNPWMCYQETENDMFCFL